MKVAEQQKFLPRLVTAEEEIYQLPGYMTTSNRNIQPIFVFDILNWFCTAVSFFTTNVNK
jgi:hypothetical protein